MRRESNTAGSRAGGGQISKDRSEPAADDAILARSAGPAREPEGPEADGLHYFTDRTSVGFFVHQGAEFVYANPAAGRMLGYSPEELLRLKYWEIIAPEDREFIIALGSDRLAKRTPRQRYECRLLRRDGDRLWVEVYADLIEYGGRPSILVTTVDIGERKRAEDALRESEGQFRALAESSTALILIHMGDNFVYTNPQATRVTGYSPAELAGLKYWEFSSPDAQELVKQRGLARLTERDRGDGQPITEHRIRTRSGEERWLASSSTSITYRGKPAVLVTGVDVTERKRAEAANRGIEARFRKVFDVSADGIALTDRQGYMTEANAAFQAMIGYTLDELKLMRPVEYTYSEDQEAERARFRELILGGHDSGRFEKRYRRKDGRVFWAEITISPIKDGDGKIESYLAVIRDIDERRRAEERISASLREKELLLKEIHHRVKNNLQITSSLLSLQANSTVDQDTVSVLRESQNRIKSMALIHEKLYQSSDIACIEFGEYAHKLGTYLIHTYGRSDIGLIVEADDIRLSIDQAIPCSLIINELITNSLKYAFPARGTGTIRIAMWRENGAHVLQVGDDGVGMPGQVDFRSTSSLGLQLVNTLVSQLEGEISLAPGKGTVFTIRFTIPDAECP